MARPASVTVFGILNIVFGSLSLMCTPFAILTFVLPRPPFDRIYADRPGLLAYMGVSTSLGVAAAILLVVAGIGLLQFRNWGRLLSVGYAAYAILAVITGTVVSVLFLLPPIMAESNSPMQAGAIGGAVGGAVGGFCGGLAYPIVLLVFMLRPSFVAAFKPPAQVEAPFAPPQQLPPSEPPEPPTGSDGGSPI